MATVMSTIQSKGTDTFEEAIDFMVDRAQTLGIYTQKKKLARSVSSQSRKKGGGKNNSNKQNNGKGGNSKSKTPSSFIARSVWETMSAEAKASHQAKYQKSLSSKASRQVSSMKRKSESKSVKFKGVDGDDDSDPDEGRTQTLDLGPTLAGLDRYKNKRNQKLVPTSRQSGVPLAPKLAYRQEWHLPTRHPNTEPPQQGLPGHSDMTRTLTQFVVAEDGLCSNIQHKTVMLHHFRDYYQPLKTYPL